MASEDPNRLLEDSPSVKPGCCPSMSLEEAFSDPPLPRRKRYSAPAFAADVSSLRAPTRSSGKPSQSMSASATMPLE